MQDFVVETRYHYHLYFEEVAEKAFVKVDLESVGPIQQRRILNSNPKTVNLKGSVTFVESLAPKIDSWESLQRGAMQGGLLQCMPWPCHHGRHCLSTP